MRHATHGLSIANSTYHRVTKDDEGKAIGADVRTKFFTFNTTFGKEKIKQRHRKSVAKYEVLR